MNGRHCARGEAGEPECVPGHCDVDAERGRCALLVDACPFAGTCVYQPAAPVVTPTRVYPLPRPINDEDPRFCNGLWIDDVDAITRRGYPKPTGIDIVELQLALFRFLYEDQPVAATEVPA